uniref:Uncharacterized protein n=1 Tax=Bionectria ochroleuca TaxID=29856 RepID=A0A8H7NLL6_BIOOC
MSEALAQLALLPHSQVLSLARVLLHACFCSLSFPNNEPDHTQLILLPKRPFFPLPSRPLTHAALLPNLLLTPCSRTPLLFYLFSRDLLHLSLILAAYYHTWGSEGGQPF